MKKDTNKKLRKVYFKEVEWYPVWVVDDSDGLPPVGIEVEVSEKDYKEIMDAFEQFKKTQDKIEELIEKHSIGSTYTTKTLDEVIKVVKELDKIMNDIVKGSEQMNSN